VFGFILLFGGLIGAVVLFVIAMRMPDEAIDNFARASVGCRTTLAFEDSGTFYVYEERNATEPPTADTEPTPDASTDTTTDVADTGCEPHATPGQPFEFRFVDSGAVVVREDRSITYDTGEHAGMSVARFAIVETGNYDIEVLGDDVTTLAAIGRDPDEGVSERQRQAIAVGLSGVILGSLLLALAGRRSKRAATPSIPDGPGWGTRPGSDMQAWPPAPPRVPQVPVNPQQPDTPARVTPPPPPLPARAPGAQTPGAAAGWAPPGQSAPVDMPPPAPLSVPRPPTMPEPKLPD
jgi:hypothetical protein